MYLTPLELLWGLLALSAVALSWSAILRSKQRRRLRRLARELQMHYIRFDQFRLGPRIIDQLPIAAAAGVEVRDVLYSLRDGEVFYLFTASYTRGLVRTRKRLSRVGAMVENRANPHLPVRLKFNDSEGCSPQQYRAMAGGMGIGASQATPALQVR